MKNNYNYNHSFNVGSSVFEWRRRDPELGKRSTWDLVNDATGRSVGFVTQESSHRWRGACLNAVGTAVTSERSTLKCVMADIENLLVVVMKGKERDKKERKERPFELPRDVEIAGRKYTWHETVKGKHWVLSASEDNPNAPIIVGFVDHDHSTYGMPNSVWYATIERGHGHCPTQYRTKQAAMEFIESYVRVRRDYELRMSFEPMLLDPERYTWRAVNDPRLGRFSRRMCWRLHDDSTDNGTGAFVFEEADGTFSTHVQGEVRLTRAEAMRKAESSFIDGQCDEAHLDRPQGHSPLFVENFAREVLARLGDSKEFIAIIGAALRDVKG